MEALVGACAAGRVPGEVVAVIADRDCEGLERAERRSLETARVIPSDFPDRDTWSAALRDEVAKHEPALVVSAGFMRILAPVFVDAYADRLINLHPALLPAFPGANAVRDALAAGVTETGSTVHFVDHLVDHGPAILQASVPVHGDDDEASLHERIKEVEHRILPEACSLFLSGKVKQEGGRVLVDDDA
jgi:phosphoribosylglycinamide formyltransferase-1